MTMEKDLKHYLQLPYTVILRRDDEGDMVARVEELPGCSAHGKTPQEALDNLDEAKKLWVTDALEAGDSVPEPFDTESLPSGKWVQRVTRTLHMNLVQMAKREGVSLNQLVTTILAEALGKKSAQPDLMVLSDEGSIRSAWKGWAVRPSMCGQTWAIRDQPTHNIDQWDAGVLDCFSLKLPNRIHMRIDAAENAKKEEERSHRVHS